MDRHKHLPRIMQNILAQRLVNFTKDQVWNKRFKSRQYYYVVCDITWRR
jgi:hypothetical protein